MLQGPSRGLCPAQTSGSPMTLTSASAAGSASKADVNLECVEAGPSTQAPGSARQVAPALGAPLNAISNPNSKQTQHGEMGLGPQRNSVSLAVAVATCAPRPPDVLSAGEGVEDVGAAAAALCVKSLRSSSSNSYVVSHPAERALRRACKPCWNVGERPSRTSSSSYVVANTGRIVSSRLSSMQLPTESAGATAEPVLLSDGKRHCGVGGWSGGRPRGASGAPGVLVMANSNSRHL